MLAEPTAHQAAPFFADTTCRYRQKSVSLQHVSIDYLPIRWSICLLFSMPRNTASASVPSAITAPRGN